MNGFKNIFASKTVLTALVGAIFALLQALNIINVDPEVQAGIVTLLFGLAGFFRVQATEQLATNPTKAAAAQRPTGY